MSYPPDISIFQRYVGYVTLVNRQPLLYVLSWWRKPVDIAKPHLVSVPDALWEQLREGPNSYEKNPTNPMWVHPTKLQLQDPTGVGKVDYDDYLIDRAGLGRLLFQLLTREGKLFTEYLETVRIANKRVIHSMPKIWKQMLLLSCLCQAYGAVHLAIWNNAFPTDVERWMWRGCACITSGLWGLLGISLFVGEIFISATRGFKRHYGSNCWSVCLGGGGILVILARLFMLVESFLELRRLPPGAYKTIEWSEGYPHAG